VALTSKTAQSLEVLRAKIAHETSTLALVELRAAWEAWNWKAAQEDPWYFLTHLALTRNELAKEGEEYRPFPQKKYLRIMLDQWLSTDAKSADKIHVMLKSRQVMASWFACAMLLWHAITGKAVRCGWQGKKAEDTDQMLKRIFGMWERLPAVAREEAPCEPRFLHLRFPDNDSDIHAIPQGEAQVRQYTWRYFVSDEMAYQEDAGQAYFALLPALGERGMLWIISTAAPGFFETLYKAPIRIESYQEPMKGMKIWQTRTNTTVCDLNWRADEDHDEAWANAQAAKYNGRQSDVWRQEYEGDFAARSGGLVFPHFSLAKHVIPPLDPALIAEWPKWRVIDPGYHNACAVGWYAVNDGTLYLYRELYEVQLEVPRIAEKVKALSGKETYEYTLIDPSAFAYTLAGSGRSIADLFVAAGVRVNPAYRAGRKKDQIPAAAALIALDENMQTRFKVTSDCENFISEIQRYRWKTRRSDEQPQTEEPVKRDDHMIDTFLYICASVDPATAAPRKTAAAERWYSQATRFLVPGGANAMRGDWEEP